jgi:hypothetical protein
MLLASTTVIVLTMTVFSRAWQCKLERRVGAGVNCKSEEGAKSRERVLLNDHWGVKASSKLAVNNARTSLNDNICLDAIE